MDKIKNIFIVSLIGLISFTGCSIKVSSETNISRDINSKDNIRDNVFVHGKEDVIIDLEKNVAYYVFEKSHLYFDAVTLCDNLVKDNIHIWTLPTYEELGSLVNITKSGTKKYDIFETIESKKYWTTKESNLGHKFKVNIDFSDGSTRDDHIFSQNGVICKSNIKLK